jgi:cytochrome b-561 domain-containing protein 2
MAEAVMIMSQDNIIASKLARQGRVRLHWILQAGAATFIFAGFLVIVINKNLHNKNHFQSWHSIIGLIFFVCVGITSSGGVVTLYSLRLKQYLRPAKLKLLHNLVGVLTFAIGVVTEIFGIYTLWFPKHASLSAQVVCTVFVVLGGILTLESAVKSAYSRFKALNQSV